MDVLMGECAKQRHGNLGGIDIQELVEVWKLRLRTGSVHT